MCSVLAVQGVALITFSINDYSIMRQKEFSRKIVNAKVKSFSWNEFNSDSSWFESEQVFTVLLFFPFRSEGDSKKIGSQPLV